VPQQRFAHAQRLCDPRGHLSILRYAANRLGAEGRIIRGSRPFASWLFGFYGKAKLFSPCPFLPDHLSIDNAKFLNKVFNAKISLSI